MKILAALLLALVSLSAAPATAQAWPDKPIRFVVSFPPGGVHDTLARVLAPALGEALGQPLVIDNRAGAGGNIAADHVAKSAPDGYTFLVGSEALATNEYLYRTLSYNAERDLAPVTKLADFPMALVVHPSLPANSLKELVVLARAKPGAMHYGSAGIGTAGHLSGELFKNLAGVDLVHVPYKGGAPALQDLVAGRIQVMILSVSLSAPHVRQGKLKALAIPGRKRADKLPEVPSAAEAGFPELEALLFSSLHAPAGTPRPTIARMSAEVIKAMRNPEVRKRVEDLGAVPVASTPEEFTHYLRAVDARWGKLIRGLNIRID
ncbi:MAG: Bug family tripartite tricarboxylate transporter substrate binding protein [Betaproteobacteria bacterium]